MSDGTLNVRYNGMQIGRIKLGGRKTRMQVLSPSEVKLFEDQPFEFYLEKQDAWVRYMDKHLRNV